MILKQTFFSTSITLLICAVWRLGLEEIDWSSSNLIFTVCVACKTQVRNRPKNQFHPNADCRIICDIWLRDFWPQTFDHHWHSVMSVAVKSPLVKCHTWWSNVCGQMSQRSNVTIPCSGQNSAAKCLVVRLSCFQTRCKPFFRLNFSKINYREYILKIAGLWTK